MADTPHSELTGAELHPALIPVGSSSPGSITIDYDGQTYAQIATDRTTLWAAQSAAWVAMGGTPIFGSSSPAGAITPDYKGQFYYGTAADTLYLAIGVTSSDWVVVAVTTPAVGSGGS